MTTRILETVLTGRNLLSPVLATAGRDVAAFNSSVTGANARAAAGAQTSAAAQGGAATSVARSNATAATSASTSAAAQSRAHATAAQSASLHSRAQVAANQALVQSNGLLGTSLTPLTAGLGAVGLALGYAGYRGMEFDAAMSEVQAASGATNTDMERLRETAITLGADTKFSGEEAAQGITEMAKAGVSTTDIINGGLKGALALASAGQMDVAAAAEIGATALSVFNLEGDQMSHVADLLAAGAGKAQGSVHDMGMALNQSALVADQAGLSIEDTAGALAMFASNGLTGSDAGTSFKTMLQALTPNSVAAAEAMDSIGFSAYDAQGNFVGLEGVAGQLRTGLAGLTEEQRAATLETIFGSDAVRAASVLYSEGSAGVAEWAGKVNDAGYASEYAAKLQDNLKGDIEKLGGAFDATMTTIGEGTQGTLRFLVQALTEIVDAGGAVLGFWNDLPGPVKIAVAVVGGFTALKGPVGSALETIQLRAMYAAENVSRLGGVAGTARTAMTNLAGVLGPLAAVTILTSAISSVIEFSQAGDAARESIKQFNGGLEDMGNAARESAVADEIDRARDSILGYQQVIEDYESQGWADRNLWYVPFGGEKAEVEDARQSLEAYERQLANLEKANARTAETTDVLAERFRLSKSEVQELADKYEIDLSGGVDETRAAFERFYTKEYGTTPNDAAVVTGEAMQSAKAQTEEAIKALEDWREELAGIAGAFVEPLAEYKGLLDEKTAAERAAAEETAAVRNEEIDEEIEALRRRTDAEIAGVEGTTAAAEETRTQMREQRDATIDSLEDSKVSWEDYVADVGVSLDEYADRLQEQLDNQDQWRENLGIIARRAGADVAQQLAAMGVEGVDLVADMANGTDAEMNRMADLLREDARRGGADAAAALDREMQVMAAIGKAGASATVQGMAYELGIGAAEVRRIADQYGIELAEGVNPILTSLGKASISIGRGNRQREFYGGGYTGDGGKYEPKGVVHGGEYVITKERTANLGLSTLENLERILPGYAGGGYVQHGSVSDSEWRNLLAAGWQGRAGDGMEALYPPAESGGWQPSRPPSTAPFRPPLSTAADATMEKGYTEVAAWVTAVNAAADAIAARAATVAGSAGTGQLGAGIAAMFAAVKQQFPQARLNSGLRPGDPGYHGLGRAIDLGQVGRAGGNGHPYLAAMNRWLHDRYGANLKELIYDGAGDDRPDLKNGRPLTYSAATRAAHKNHVHVAREHGGGFWPGQDFLVGEKGPEIARFGGVGTIIPADRTATMLAPAAQPGYGAVPAGSGGPVAISVAAAPVRIYLDGQEWRGMARVEAETVLKKRDAEFHRNFRSTLS